MDQDFRLTAKFKPLNDVVEENIISTDSCLTVPSQPTHSVQWTRKYAENIQLLHHLDNQPSYMCTHLDAGCVIEAYVTNPQNQYSHIPYSSYSSQPLIYSFGPVEPIVDWDKIYEDPSSDFIVDIAISPSKTYQCMLYLSQNHIQLKPRSYLGVGQNSFHIGPQEVSLCYVEENSHNPYGNFYPKTIVFPSILLRTACLKLFNEIISKGSYTENNDHLKMKLRSVFLPGDGVQTQADKKMENYILNHINKMKHDKERRTSQISSYMGKKIPKPSILSTQAKKSHSDIRQDSEDSFRVIKKPIQNEKQKMKTSEFISNNNKIQRDSNVAASQSEHPASVQEEGNYFSQFQNLIYDKQGEQQQTQLLLLNDSFQQLQKNSNTEQQIQKLKGIRQKKMERQVNQSSKAERLKIKLIDLKIEKEQLLKINKKLKQDIQKIENMKSSGTLDQAMLMEKAKNQLQDLKNQYKALTENKGKRNIYSGHKVMNTEQYSSHVKMNF